MIEQSGFSLPRVKFHWICGLCLLHVFSFERERGKKNKEAERVNIGFALRDHWEKKTVDVFHALCISKGEKLIQGQVLIGEKVNRRY